MDSKYSLELDQANHFMRWLTLGKFTLLEKPDVQRLSRRGGHPDFRFKDDTGKEYVLEITRLLDKRLRNLEKFIEKNICAQIRGQLLGTYVLETKVDPIGRGYITPKMANQTVKEVLEIVQRDNSFRDYQLSTGFVLWKAREDGSRLIPQLVAPELPENLRLDDPIAKELEKEFNKILRETNDKFQGFTGVRILLIGTAQSGFNWEFHMSQFKDGQGVMLTWAENYGNMLVNVDYICIEPGISVWRPAPDYNKTSRLKKVFTGHKYIDNKAGFYVLLWQQKGTPSLFP